METIDIEVVLERRDAIAVEPGNDARAEFSEGLHADASCSLAMLHAPQAALEAARRLYRHNRSGLRFFCENRRVVPVDQLEALGEFGESTDAPPAVFAATSSVSGVTRNTM